MSDVGEGPPGLPSAPAGGVGPIDWPRPPGRARRRWYRFAVLVAVVAVVVGVVVAIRGYGRSSGPDGAVRGYFAALARGDAPGALSFGDRPAGSRSLLTSTVLREQRRIAPLGDVRVRDVHRAGDRASVDVDYTLAFPGDRQRRSTTVAVERRGDRWRLRETTVPTAVRLDRASQRATLAGAALPTRPVAMFPGALPVEFDTHYLTARPASDVVSFGGGATTEVQVEVSAAGRQAASDAVRRALADCLAGRGDLRCPLPDERSVPGTLRGTLVGSSGGLTAVLGNDAVGTIRITGKVRVHATYRRLGFDNQASTVRDDVDVPVDARTYAIDPLHITWAAPT